jgi:hypothetical protein
MHDGKTNWDCPEELKDADGFVQFAKSLKEIF